MGGRIRRYHRLNAFLLGLFLLLHLGNHAFLLFGIEPHIKVMGTLRSVYRIPVLEPVLILLFAVQIGLGVALILSRGRPKGRWAWAQVLSGGYIAFFLLQHVPAVLSARLSKSVPDTNGYFAAAVVKETYVTFYFAPYYVLAVVAVFTHVAAAIYFRSYPAPAYVWVPMLPLMGLALGGVAVGVLMGIWADYGLPAQYRSYMEAFRWE